MTSHGLVQGTAVYIDTRTGDEAQHWVVDFERDEAIHSWNEVFLLHRDRIDLDKRYSSYAEGDDGVRASARHYSMSAEKEASFFSPG